MDWYAISYLIEACQAQAVDSVLSAVWAVPQVQLAVAGFQLGVLLTIFRNID